MERERLPQSVYQFEKTGQLSDLYAFQHVYQIALGYEVPGGLEPARRNVLYSFMELAELLNELPWKWHREYLTEPSLDALAEEFADTLVFQMNILLHMGVTAAGLHRAVVSVLKKNVERLEAGTNTGEPG